MTERPHPGRSRVQSEEHSPRPRPPGVETEAEGKRSLGPGSGPGSTLDTQQESGPRRLGLGALGAWGQMTDSWLRGAAPGTVGCTAAPPASTGQMPVAPPGPALASKRVPTYDTAARPLAEEHGAGCFLKLRPRLLRQLRKLGSPLFPAAQDLQVSAAKPRPRPLIPRQTGTVGHPARSVPSVSVRPALTAAPRTPGPHPAPRTPGPSHSSPLPSSGRSSPSTCCVGPCALCGRAPSGPRSSDCCVPRAHDSAWRTEVGAQQIPSHEGSGR